MCSVLKFSKFSCIFHSVSQVLICGLHMQTPDSMDIQNRNKWLPYHHIQWCMVSMVPTPRHFKERNVTLQNTCKYLGNIQKTMIWKDIFILIRGISGKLELIKGCYKNCLWLCKMTMVHAGNKIPTVWKK